MDSVGEVLKRLAVLDEERVELLTQLRTMGFRTRGLVGEYGELLAAALYDTPLPVSSQPGYDLEVPGLGLVQVKTLRSSTRQRPHQHGSDEGPVRHPSGHPPRR